MKVYGHVIASSTVLTASSWTAAIDAFFKDVAVAQMHQRLAPSKSGVNPLRVTEPVFVIDDSIGRMKWPS